MTEVHHFAYGWINPAFAFILSFLGSLLGLLLTARSRQAASRAGRVRLLVLAGVAIGGTGIWLMHFMAMLGFDVPAAAVRYRVPATIGSLVVAVVVVTAGLLVVGTGRRSAGRVVAGGVVTGLGVAAMHYLGMAALHVGGRISYAPTFVAASIAIAIVASTVALWFAVVVSGTAATIGAATVMGVAVSGMHYTAMAAVTVRLDNSAAVGAVRPLVLMVPIMIIAGLAISALAYASVSSSLGADSADDERYLLQMTGPRPAVTFARPSADRATPLRAPLTDL